MKKWTRLMYKPCLPLGKDGKCVTASQEHIDISRKAATEGIVLLKNNDNVLPLKKGEKIVVFGKAQFDYKHCGGGSGEVIVPYVRNIIDGLKIKEKENKISIYNDLLETYKKIFDEQNAINKDVGILENLFYAEEPFLTDAQIQKARQFADKAIITICRFSGEGWDRKGKKYDGDYYLSKSEEKMINDVTNIFDNVIVVINAGAQTDSSWYADNDKIKGVLYVWQGGMEGGLATADVLCGDANPSGKLVDTFTKSYEDYPSSESFSENLDYVKYYEDIYVGYRYFETIKDADKKVNYPFGYGLSYTKFKIDNISVCEKDGLIKINADVSNTGSLPGKEVLQVYYSAPEGKLGKPKYELGAFVKTDELKPGDKKTYSCEFILNDMASYDDLGKVCQSSYVLEKGTYRFYVGNSVRNTVKADFEYVLNEDKVVCTLSRQAAPSRLEKRMLSDGNYEKMPAFEKNDVKNNYEPNKASSPEKTAMLIDVFENRVSMDEFLSQLSDEELVYLTHGDDSVYTNSGLGGTNAMGGFEKYGIPTVLTTDGPAGMRVRRGLGMFTTSFPCATMLACTWNTDLIYEVGRAAALEVKENNMGIWLAPAMNIHRNPLCGRNFEYFSEDPVVSGKMGASEVKGIQSVNIAATIKHFCVNNKEENRKESDSILSERALREIYLKGFEICVKEADPWAVMSSYNIVNGKRASENRDTLTTILRDEWGYKGMVMSDWWNKATLSNEVVAGNDVRMPTSEGQDKELIENIKTGKVSRRDVEIAVSRLLEMIMKLD